MASTAESVPLVIMPGFSLANRILLYASLLTGPASFWSGAESKLPIGAGFLGYTVYQQYLIFAAAQRKQLHALCLLPVYLNTLYAISYSSGVSSASYVVSTIMCIGTIVALIINLATTWIGYLTNMPEGYGVYKFFFFGTRTLTPRWRYLFLFWGVVDIFMTLTYIVGAIRVAIITPSPELQDMLEDRKEEPSWRLFVDTALIWGSIAFLIAYWPFVLWVEMLIRKNNIVSETDMVSVYLFIAQVALLAIPSLFNIARTFYKIYYP